MANNLCSDTADPKVIIIHPHLLSHSLLSDDNVRSDSLRCVTSHSQANHLFMIASVDESQLYVAIIYCDNIYRDLFLSYHPGRLL